jgi:HTH-type transcriptional regulator / antitoxin HigA
MIKVMFDKKIIKNETEYRAALAAIEPFLQKGFEHLTAAEEEELSRISGLIEAFENAYYPMPFNPKTMNEMLELKMFQMKMKQKDLAKYLGVTENRISEVLNGKRAVNMDLAKRFYTKLEIDPKFILENV